MKDIIVLIILFLVFWSCDSNSSQPSQDYQDTNVVLDKRIINAITDYYLAYPQNRHLLNTENLCFVVFNDSILDIFNSICFPIYLNEKNETDTTIVIKGAFLYGDTQVIIMDNVNKKHSSFYQEDGLSKEMADSLLKISNQNIKPGNCRGPIWVYRILPDTMFRYTVLNN